VRSYQNNMPRFRLVRGVSGWGLSHFTLTTINFASIHGHGLLVLMCNTRLEAISQLDTCSKASWFRNIVGFKILIMC